jgi:four helix bundle protein
MIKNQNSKPYDLEERTLKFANEVRVLVKKMSRTIGNIEDGKQVIRSSGSIGANYIEANESLSKKDFIMRIKICRKEGKETQYWLQLIDLSNNAELNEIRNKLLQEARELTKIFGAILEKTKS